MTLARRRPLRRESADRRVEQAVRRAIAAEVGPTGCRLRILNVCTGRAENLHELVGAGQGGSRVDRRNLAPACDRCNGWVEDFPELARRYRWKVPRHQAVPGNRGLVPADPNPYAIDHGGWDA